MDQGFLALMELRNSYDKYIEVCQGFADNNYQKERWMLHYDVLRLLIDDERLNEKGGPEYENQRFILLEGLSTEVAKELQNHHLAKQKKPPLYNAIADAIDRKTGDLIELKVTWVLEMGVTNYLDRSKKAAEELGMKLVVADTNSCQVFQPHGLVFTKGINSVVEALLARKEVMDKFNLSDQSTLHPIEIKPLPKFLQEKFNTLNLKDEEFFDKDKAVYKSKSREVWDKERLEALDRIRSDDRQLKRNLSDLSIYAPSSSKMIRLSDDDIINSANRAAKVMQDQGVLVGIKRKIKDTQTRKLKKRKWGAQLEDILSDSKFLEVPVANKVASIVIRPLDWKENILEEMNPVKLLGRLNRLDSEGKVMKWKGLVPPIGHLKLFENLTLEEVGMQLKFEEPFIFSRDGENDFLGFKGLMNELSKRPLDILELSSKNLSSVLSGSREGKEILDLFGVGWKDCKQVGLEEPKGLNFQFEIKLHKGSDGYPEWFEEIRKDLMGDNWIDGYVMPSLSRRETVSFHPVDVWTERITNIILNNLQRTNLLLYCSMVENIYNRLGGLLSASEGMSKEKKEGKRQYMNLRVQANFLESICYKELGNEESKFKIQAGVIFRGPSHARNPTDSTNLFILSFFDPKKLQEISMCSIQEIYPNYTFGKAQMMGESFIYGIRRYASRRIDPTFYSFVTNAMFEPFNSLGDHIFTDMSNCGFDNIDFDEYTSDEVVQVLKARIAENIIVGVNMTNFDEGLMPYVRYEFLNSQSRRAGEKNYNLDYSEYLDKLEGEYRSAGVSRWLLRQSVTELREPL